MWTVEYESEKTAKEAESQNFSDEDKAIIGAWIRQMNMHGPESICGDFKWQDHELHDDWEGYRVSCFSNSGRIIYKIIEDKILIQIARITQNHDYKRSENEKTK